MGSAPRVTEKTNNAHESVKIEFLIYIAVVFGVPEATGAHVEANFSLLEHNDGAVELEALAHILRLLDYLL